MCGEKFRAYVKIWNEWGSPPHMRGKGFARCLNDLVDGITPAYAGKRVMDDAYIDIYYGSPPRMQGKTKKIP